MEAMVEPDRTIMIVSIIGIVIIWGSFFYHKFVQGGGGGDDSSGSSAQSLESEIPAKESVEAGTEEQQLVDNVFPIENQPKSGSRKKGKKKRR